MTEDKKAKKSSKGGTKGAGEIKLIAVVRVRGVRNIKPKIKHTLKLLGLNKPNHATVLRENPGVMGMLNIVKDYVTYGYISKEDFTYLLKKRGYKGSKRLAELGEDAINAAVEMFLKEGKRDFDRIFRLHPPRKGWKDIKKAAKVGGSLGLREDMPSLLRRMA